MHTRRSAIVHGVSMAAVGVLGPRLFQDAANHASSLARRLTALFGDPHSAAVVGERFLASSGEVGDWRAMLQGVFADHPHRADALAHLSEAALRREVAAMVNEDFARGNTLRVDGWMLSRTEGRLFALSALVT